MQTAVFRLLRERNTTGKAFARAPLLVFCCVLCSVFESSTWPKWEEVADGPARLRACADGLVLRGMAGEMYL